MSLLSLRPDSPVCPPRVMAIPHLRACFAAVRRTRAACSLAVAAGGSFISLLACRAMAAASKADTMDIWASMCGATAAVDSGVAPAPDKISAHASSSAGLLRMRSCALGRTSGSLAKHRMASVRRGLEYCSGSGGGCACCTCRTSPSILFALNGSLSAIISYRMHPSAQMSALCPYGTWRNISGLMKMGVPMKVRAATLSNCSSRAMPKSPSATRDRPLGSEAPRWSRRRKMLPLLRSRCSVLWLCRCSTPRMICANQSTTTSSGRCLRFFFWRARRVARSPPAQCGMTM
mmetsp:Transcript_27470/g.68805  ORF Transcript_27470/g.68805 Transcript_27470/m.68805 type:complete len:290 (+) Transcript_27470:284-1153(+)